jgi:hypothetical protein
MLSTRDSGCRKRDFFSGNVEYFTYYNLDIENRTLPPKFLVGHILNSLVLAVKIFGGMRCQKPKVYKNH